MFALLAKTLDRLIIRAAAGTVGREPGLRPRASEAGALLTVPDFFGDFVRAPRDLVFSNERDFEFTSPVTTAFAVNNRVRGKFFRAAESWPQRPTVLLLHGWNAECGYYTLFPRVAARFGKLGVNAVMIELPYHAQRKPRNNGASCNFISEDLARMVEATRQAVADARAIVHWIKDQGSPAVGAWGFSMGAWITGFTACHEPRLDAAVLATPVVNLERAIGELEFCEPIRRSLAESKVPLERLSLMNHSPRVRRDRLLMIEARYDQFMPPETVEALWQRWGEPEIWRVAHGHVSVWISPWLLTRAARWLAERLLRH